MVDQMLQISTKQFYVFNKRTTFIIQRIIYIFNEIIILIQRIIYIFNEIIILIQRIIYVFNGIIILTQELFTYSTKELFSFKELFIYLTKELFSFNELFLYSTIYLCTQGWTNNFLHVQRLRNFLSSLQNPRITNLVPKFSTWFLVSSRNFFHRNILFGRPKILLRMIFIIWYSNRTNFLKIDCVSQYTWEMLF